MKRLLSLILTLAICVIIFAGCSTTTATSTDSQQSSTTTSTNADEIKIGVILPLSGDAVSMGEKQLAGIKLFVDNYNNAGGVASMNNAKIKLVVSDTTSKPEVGVTEIERLIQQESVSAVIGPYQSAVGSATAPIAEKYKVPYLLSNCTSDGILTNNYEYVFRANNSNSENAAVLIDFTKEYGEKSGNTPKTYAIIYENTDWGKGMHDALVSSINTNIPDAEIVLEEIYQANSADMSSIVNKIKSVNPDVVIPASFLTIQFVTLFYQSYALLKKGIHKS